MLAKMHLKLFCLTALIFSGISFSQEKTLVVIPEKSGSYIIPKGKLGVTVAPVRVMIDQITYRGCQILEVIADSPASKNRLEANDIITEVNGTKTLKPADILAEIEKSNGKIAIKAIDSRTGRIVEIKDIELEMVKK
ncbi:PDZ domain-containing protein [Zavarzinella formosa]|uniref:PDZ domain-containing protein n=1 Tax=Zavarzinella formosa TaxID=360055 RepID=UPI00030B8951|nr:PDZ domain-containing protein [Zavarzinella formosa]